jgi:hypothetical protein
MGVIAYKVKIQEASNFRRSLRDIGETFPSWDAGGQEIFQAAAMEVITTSSI